MAASEVKWMQYSIGVAAAVAGFAVAVMDRTSAVVEALGLVAGVIGLYVAGRAHKGPRRAHDSEPVARNDGKVDATPVQATPVAQRVMRGVSSVLALIVFAGVAIAVYPDRDGGSYVPLLVLAACALLMLFLRYRFRR